MQNLTSQIHQTPFMFFVNIDGVLVNFLKRFCEHYYRETKIFVNWWEISNYNLKAKFKLLKRYL